MAAVGVPETSLDPRRRSQRLVLATIAWNVIEAIAALAAGAIASSTALIGFGLDSSIEVAASVVAVWYLAGVEGEREHRARRTIGVLFYVLAAYISVDAVRDLVSGGSAEVSAAGIVIAATSLIVMPLLARAKRRAAAAIGSSALLAESRESLLCAYLSAVVLIGLVVRAAVGWTWADPAAALFIAALAVREGRACWRGDDCC